LLRKDREIQREERRRRIRDSRYNSWYEAIRTEGIPEYLKRGWREIRWRRIIRFRLGNEIKESLYWEEENKRICRLCGGEEETWEHIHGRDVGTGG